MHKIKCMSARMPCSDGIDIQFFHPNFRPWHRTRVFSLTRKQNKGGSNSSECVCSLCVCSLCLECIVVDRARRNGSMTLTPSDCKEEGLSVCMSSVGE